MAWGIRYPIKAYPDFVSQPRPRFGLDTRIVMALAWVHFDGALPPQRKSAGRWQPVGSPAIHPHAASAVLLAGLLTPEGEAQQRTARVQRGVGPDRHTGKALYTGYALTRCH